MKKIAIIRKNGIGDFISGTVPLCNYLLKKYNNEVEFTFFMTRRNIGIAKYFFPNSKSVLIPDGNKYYTHIKVALQNRSLHPDIGIIPVPDYPKLGSIFFKLLDAKKIYGNHYNNDIAKAILTNPCTLYKDKATEHAHVSLRSLHLFDTGFKETPKDLYPQFDKTLIADFSLENKGPYIMVELSNARKTSQLSVEKTATILNELYQCFKFTTLITLMPSDVKKAEDLKALLSGACEYHLTKNLDEFISYVNTSNFVLAGDGGLSHIAGAMNKKVITLMGQTPKYLWSVLGKEVINIFDPKDVNNIPNKDIIAAFKKLI